MPKIAGACPDHLPMFIGVLTLMYACVCHCWHQIVIIKRSTAGVCHETPGLYVNAEDIHGANCPGWSYPPQRWQDLGFELRGEFKASGSFNLSRGEVVCNLALASYAVQPHVRRESLIQLSMSNYCFNCNREMYSHTTAKMSILFCLSLT